MQDKKIIILLITILSIVSFSFAPGCSEDDSKTQMEKEKALQERKIEAYREKLREELRRKKEGLEKEAIIQIDPDNKNQKKNIASAEACQKSFELCVERCENSRCENSCLKKLSECEKTLPAEIQTLKKQQTSRQ
jgi:hypothetical protein